MKTENIFIGDIGQITKINRIPGKIEGLLKNPILEYLLTERMEIIGVPIKKHVLLRKINDYTYQDIETRKKYSNIPEYTVGSLIVLEETLIPINILFKKEQLEKNLTRRKIKKLYNNLKQKVCEEYLENNN